MADTTPKSYSADPTLYLYTSLTAGSSHIITATSRLETILKANKIAFRAIDVATDEKARMLWGRRSKGKKLPGLVKFGSIVGDLEEVEEWNEYGELKQHIGSTQAAIPTPTTSASTTPSKPAPPIPIPNATSKPSSDVPSASPQGKEFSEGAESSPTSPLKKEETPLTMAMRQAGAEAAKKAGERKGLMSRARPSTKTSEATDIPMPAVEAKMAKSAEEPGASAETTAAKIPEKLAEEGAKRTSVDKIAEEGVKRTSMEGATESDSISQQEQVGISKEASNLEARRASSITKLKSPLSTETAARSSTELGASSMESNPETHRGSSVSLASKEEIQGIEKRDAIPEETEEANESAEQAEAQDDEALPTVKAETAGGDSDNATLSGVTASDEAELSATKGVKPQEDNAREAAGASTSVGD